MFAQMMNGPRMDGGMVMACMMAMTLFVLVLVAAIIFQTILQAKILREVRRLRDQKPTQTGPKTPPV